MLSLSRLAVTASVAAALAVPAAAQARPDAGGLHWDDNVPTCHRQGLARRPSGRARRDALRRSSVRARRPRSSRPTTASSGPTPPIGGGAALLLTAVVGGAALTIRPRRAGALH